MSSLNICGGRAFLEPSLVLLLVCMYAFSSSLPGSVMSTRSYTMLLLSKIMVTLCWRFFTCNRAIMWVRPKSTRKKLNRPHHPRAPHLPPCYPICRTCTLSPPFSVGLLLYSGVTYSALCSQTVCATVRMAISRKTVCWCLGTIIILLRSVAELGGRQNVVVGRVWSWFFIIRNSKRVISGRRPITVGEGMLQRMRVRIRYTELRLGYRTVGKIVHTMMLYGYRE